MRTKRFSDFEARLAVLVVVVVGGFVILPMVGTALWRVSESKALSFVLAAAWLLSVLVSLVRYTSLRCPTCGESFFGDTQYHNIFTSKCLSCGAPFPRLR
jgi:hypothetical protein